MWLLILLLSFQTYKHTNSTIIYYKATTWLDPLDKTVLTPSAFCQAPGIPPFLISYSHENSTTYFVSPTHGKFLQGKGSGEYRTSDCQMDGGINEAGYPSCEAVCSYSSACVTTKHWDRSMLTDLRLSWQGGTLHPVINGLQAHGYTAEDKPV